MRRCKYEVVNKYSKLVNNELLLTREWFCLHDNEEGCIEYKECNNYIPVEVDPYWKDIIDETNRRLNNE